MTETVAQKAGALNLVIEQGATFNPRLTLTDSTGAAVDLTGYVARAQMRATVKSTDVLLECTTENDRLVITPATGVIDFAISAEDTAALVWTSGVYDLEIESPTGEVTRVLQGSVRVSPEVTRPQPQ